MLLSVLAHSLFYVMAVYVNRNAQKYPRMGTDTQGWVWITREGYRDTQVWVEMPRNGYRYPGMGMDNQGWV